VYGMTGAALGAFLGLRGVDLAGVLTLGGGVASTSGSTSESSSGLGELVEDDGKGVAICSCSGDSDLTALVALVLGLEGWT